MNLNQLLEQTIAIVKEAGGFIRRERENFSRDKVEVKGKNDLVSYVDKTAEEMLVTGLRKILPASGFITEENTANNKGEYNWIIDPLDGTTNFIHGIPCYAVSVGLEHNGEVIVGVVYEVSRDECFSAHQHSPAYLNGKEIKVSACAALNDALVITGLPVNDYSRMKAYMELIEYCIRNTHGIRRLGSAATDLCYVACGRADVFFEYNLKPWDVAGGLLIAKQAGALVCDFSGGSDFLFGKEICTAPPALMPEFLNLIAPAFNEGV